MLKIITYVDTFQEAATSRDLYLPPGSRWYDVSRLLTEGVWSESEVGVVTMATPLDLLPLHVRGGQVRDSNRGSLNYTLKSAVFKAVQ